MENPLLESSPGVLLEFLVEVNSERNSFTSAANGLFSADSGFLYDFLS